MNCRDKITSNTYLSMENSPATSYVAATFHPTIGQCAHQSFSNTATPELGMIPTRNKGTLTYSHIAKGISKFIQAKQSWVYRDAKELEGMTAKLVSSSTELWTPTSNLSWLLNIYPPNTRSLPFSAT